MNGRPNIENIKARAEYAGPYGKIHGAPRTLASLCAYVERLEAERSQPFGTGATGERETDPGKLRFLAAWIDSEQDRRWPENTSYEVQDDLRRIANQIEKIEGYRHELLAMLATAKSAIKTHPGDRDGCFYCCLLDEIDAVLAS